MQRKVPTEGRRRKGRGKFEENRFPSLSLLFGASKERIDGVINYFCCFLIAASKIKKKKNVFLVVKAAKLIEEDERGRKSLPKKSFLRGSINL